MRQLDLGDRVIKEGDVYVVAEIGSNHQGDADLCEKMIFEAARCGAHAVKLQKRDNQAMFTKTALARPYDNEYSYGATYGDHRRHLDWFGISEWVRFKVAAKKAGITLFATAFDIESASFMRALNNPIWKIASCDVTNLPLVRRIAEYKGPMIVSTGGAAPEEIMRLANELDEINQNYALLHCVSLYPNEDSDLHLRDIVALRNLFPRTLIGFSSHHAGTLPLMIARSLGASIFEVHFTLNRGSKGTDHGFSMEPDGLRKICEDLPRVDVMLGNGSERDLARERKGFVSKMGKGIYLTRPLKAGDRIGAVDICIKAPMTGGLEPWENVIGRELTEDCSTGVNLTEEMLKPNFTYLTTADDARDSTAVGSLIRFIYQKDGKD